jgi:hypothetical protein
VDAKTAEPVRRVILKFWEHAVERTEAEIEELKALGLFVRDARPDEPVAGHLAAVTVSEPLPASPPVTPPQPPAAAPATTAPQGGKEKTIP